MTHTTDSSAATINYNVIKEPSTKTKYNKVGEALNSLETTLIEIQELPMILNKTFNFVLVDEPELDSVCDTKIYDGSDLCITINRVNDAFQDTLNKIKQIIESSDL